MTTILERYTTKMDRQHMLALTVVTQHRQAPVKSSIASPML